MIRKAFRMWVNAGREQEYARRHEPVWRELEEALLAHGVHRYSIFLDPDSSELFAYVEVESEEQWDAVAATDACRRWWRHMRDLMPHEPDNRPKTVDLREVFHLEAAGSRAAGEPL